MNINPQEPAQFSSSLKDPKLAFISLGFLYLSSFCMVACIGFNPWEWLLLDIIVVLAVYHHEQVFELPYRDALQRALPKGIWLHVGLCILTILIVIAISLIVPDPSHAFFKDAETILKACFKDATTAISIFFATLRFLLVAYIGAQLVFAIFQISRGESPLPLLMPALAVVIAIAVGSTVTSLVLQGTTCSALLKSIPLAIALVS